MILKKYDLQDLLYNAINAMGGKANIIDVCKYVWAHHEKDLKKSGDLFYTWQYDIRWAAVELRKNNRMKAAEKSPNGIWEII